MWDSLSVGFLKCDVVYDVVSFKCDTSYGISVIPAIIIESVLSKVFLIVSYYFIYIYVPLAIFTIIYPLCHHVLITTRETSNSDSSLYK